MRGLSDLYYGALAKTNGPWPPRYVNVTIARDVIDRFYATSTDFAIDAWTHIAAWTDFCETKEIPYQNLADYYKWSSTVAGPATSC